MSAPAEQQWAKVPESVAYAGLDATALNVLIIMASKAGRDRITWITQRTIGERLGLHRTTIGKAIRRLEKLDFVRKCGRVVVDYDLGTWVQKYKVAPYQPEVRPESASGVDGEEPEERLAGTRSASRQGPDVNGQGPDVNPGRSHSVPQYSVPLDISSSAFSEATAVGEEKQERAQDQEQRRIEEEERYHQRMRDSANVWREKQQELLRRK